MSSPAAPMGIVARDLGDKLVRWELSNPARRNAVTPDALRWIASTARTLSGEIVVLAGAGNEAFCAGFDLDSLAGASTLEAPDLPLIEATLAMSRADATFVGMLNGYAIGAGVELACACDLLVAREDAWFQVPAGRLGVVYHADGLERIRTRFGSTLARRLVLLGERIHASEATTAGALVRCVPADRLESAVHEVVTKLQVTAPLALRGNRDLLRRLDDGTLDPGLRATHERARALAYGSDDHREARRAVAERRPPRFRGR